ncbi:MAG: hypothetical protein BWY25_01986 [Chloroflexi bacterium ADurb.Bin222]|nr:MAG: hypothetical protein BWY25_01986 [Chloroflexi bacterium ADurb.Bin222]
MLWSLVDVTFHHSLGKTQRAANDIRLDQHVWGVASRFKAFVMRDLLEPPPVDTEGKPVVRNTFRLLTVQWNSWEAITPFEKLSDVVGRMAMITQVRHALRQAIETEHAIGNRIYEDDDGIHFLVADVEWGTELETLVRNIVNDASGGELLPVVTLSGPTERVTDLARQMAEARKTLPIVGSPVWLEGWQREGATELCPVCHRRPSPGDGALCSWCKEQRDEGFRQRHAQSGIPQDKRRADASSAEAQSESTQPAGTLQTGELADERGKTALIVARFDLEDWLKGDLLHTLFITSPQDVAQSQDLTDASDWDWRRLRTMLQLKETALAELDAYEAAVKQAEDTLNSKCKDLREQHKQEDGEKTKRQRFVENTGMPVERRQALLAECDRKLRDTATRIAVLETETAALNAQLEAIRQQPLSPEARIARFSKKYSRLDKAVELAAEIAKDYGLSPDDALLLALARKNPSAARLLRVWQTTEEFLQGQADALAGAVGPQRQRAVLTLYGTTPPEGYSTAELPGLGAVDVWVRTDDKVCKVQTATYLKAKQIERLKAAAATGAPLRWLSGEGATRTGEATIVHVDVESYAPYQVITRSPNLLLAMVPADRALEIAQQIQSAYAAEFSKVQGRLPFHVGLAFMDAHYPMFAALDTARRLAETFDTLGNRWMEAQIRQVEETTGAGDGKDYTLELESARFGSWKWTISARLGNGAPDWYHPYVLVKAGADLEQRGMSLQGPQGRWVHVSQVEVGDTISFLPNLYDFISLDTVSRRLEAGLLPDATRRAHPLLGSRHSPRPYLLERVNELQAVWDAICNVSGMSESRLQAATTLLARKWEEWQLSQHDTHRAEYAWLVQHTVARDFGGNPVIEQAILDGMYFDVIDLYRHILKQSLEKSKTQTTEEAAS